MLVRIHFDVLGHSRLSALEKMVLVMALENYANLRAGETRGNVKAKQTADREIEVASHLRDEVLEGEALTTIIHRALEG